MRQSSLYIHIPWCIKKCPYCDFNSHKASDILAETQYVDALIKDLKEDLKYFLPKELTSIFIGGGTPSLFSAKSYEKLLNQINQLLPFEQNIEITLEANPGTIESKKFKDYKTVGINRLSIGIQSFNDKHLQILGRIHNAQEARLAIKNAQLAGFDNLNLDLMFGLPDQTIDEGIKDISEAINHNPNHISWYQLTLEPNTVFYKEKPTLPDNEYIFKLEQEGLNLLSLAKYNRYEISAFCKNNQEAKHNLNYWLFGDYYGIGAGAHGKYTSKDKIIYRTRKHRIPEDYLKGAFLVDKNQISIKEIIFEFMLNTTRLNQKIPNNLFKEKTGLEFNLLKTHLLQAVEKGLIELHESFWQVTRLGRLFTNDLQLIFLAD